MNDPYQIERLEPAKVMLMREVGGVLSAVIDGVKYPEVILYRTFPLSHPMHYLAVCTPNGDEIGIIEDLFELDPDSQQEAQLELKLRYLVPTVTRIDKIKEEPGLWIWELQTDRGPMSLLMRNLHDHVQVFGTTRLLITDMNGRRCEITDIRHLDAHSKKELRKIL